MSLSDYEAGLITARLGDVALGPRIVATGEIRPEGEAHLVALAVEAGKMALSTGVKLRISPNPEGRLTWYASRFEWALDALEWLEKEGATLGPHLHWIQGLLYGISPAQIHAYMDREGHS